MMLWYRAIAGEGRRRLPWALRWCTSENGINWCFYSWGAQWFVPSLSPTNLDLTWNFTAGTWWRFLAAIALLHQIAAALLTCPGVAAALSITPRGWVTIWLMLLVNISWRHSRAPAVQTPVSVVCPHAELKTGRKEGLCSPVSPWLNLASPI